MAAKRVRRNLAKLKTINIEKELKADVIINSNEKFALQIFSRAMTFFSDPLRSR